MSRTRSFSDLRDCSEARGTGGVCLTSVPVVPEVEATLAAGWGRETEEVETDEVGKVLLVRLSRRIGGRIVRDAMNEGGKRADGGILGPGGGVKTSSAIASCNAEDGESSALPVGESTHLTGGSVGSFKRINSELGCLVFGKCGLGA